MSELTRILAAVEQGDPHAAEQLLPLVYDELRQLAASKLAQEKPGQTLQPTALVHEAYLRLVGSSKTSTPSQAGASTPLAGPEFANRSHFFAAAAEAMRRILIDRARHKRTLKRGAQARQVDLDQLPLTIEQRSEELLALDEGLTELERHDPQAAQLVKLRYFAGLNHQQAAETLGLTRRTADRRWAVARAWLYQWLNQS